jgi:hypothetical protein
VRRARHATATDKVLSAHGIFNYVELSCTKQEHNVEIPHRADALFNKTDRVVSSGMAFGRGSYILSFMC